MRPPHGGGNVVATPTQVRPQPKDPPPWQPEPSPSYHHPCEDTDPGLVVKVKITGRTLNDLLDALDQVRRAVADETPFGHGDNGDGSFEFSVEGIEL